MSELEHTSLERPPNGELLEGEACGGQHPIPAQACTRTNAR